jgi:hypothetical protein
MWIKICKCLISENRTSNTAGWHFDYLPAKWITPHKIVSYQLYVLQITALAAYPSSSKSLS